MNNLSPIPNPPFTILKLQTNNSIIIKPFEYTVGVSANKCMNFQSPYTKFFIGGSVRGSV